MDTRRAVMGCLLSLCCAVGCRALLGIDDYQDAPITSPAGSTGGGGQGNTSTTSSSGEGGMAGAGGTGGSAGVGAGASGAQCPGGINLGVGETPECDSCLETHCCEEFASCPGDPLACANLVGCGIADPCGSSCRYPICDSGIVLVFRKSCADCSAAHCCAEYQTCELNTACSACMNGDAPSCDATTLDNDAIDCQLTNCSSACTP